MNLLPEQPRKRVKLEYGMRALFVGASTLASVAGVALLTLVPAVFVSFENGHVQERSTLEVLGEQSKKDREDIARAQTLLADVLPLATSSPSIVAMFNKVLSFKPSGVRVESISFSSDKGRTLTVSGVSSGRDALNTYRNALVNTNVFGRVSLPVDALVGSSLGAFSITLSGGF
ncbi:MAG TPA: hypothetical protein VJH33_03600 [Candidatus Paceibacterota bacterium]